MAKTNVTQIEHYIHYPVCGYCMTAWDIIYRRQRAVHISPAEWIGYCHWGGCDPTIWDFIDEGTGWPLGWKFKGGKHEWVKIRKLPMPQTDNRCYHRRANSDENAPWRKAAPKLLAEARRKRRRGSPEDEALFEDDEDLVSVGDVDDDIW